MSHACLLIPAWQSCQTYTSDNDVTHRLEHEAAPALSVLVAEARIAFAVTVKDRLEAECSVV